MIRKILDRVKSVSWRPLRKIVAAGLSGLTTAGVVAFLAESGVEVGEATASVIVWLATVAAGYLTPERKTTG